MVLQSFPVNSTITLPCSGVLHRCCVYIHIHIHIHTYIHTCMNTCINTYIHTHAHIYTYTHAHKHTCIHACIHACMHACMHAYLHTGTGNPQDYILRKSVKCSEWPRYHTTRGEARHLIGVRDCTDQGSLASSVELSYPLKLGSWLGLLGVW